MLAGVPEHKQAKIAGGNTARVYNFYSGETDRHCLKSQPLRIDETLSDRTAAFTHATMIEYDDRHRVAYR
jgi:hypothetical protein